ncbi:hypothetical protein [Streptomyces sp. NPDC047718]|uniref:hypothetical protein n=1 Tax=Streptomyces sp. NPDC047718 TaxID=3155479 RepID=UPI0033D6FB46
MLSTGRARLARVAGADTTARAAVEDDEALELPASLAGRDRPAAEPDAADAWRRTAPGCRWRWR